MVEKNLYSKLYKIASALNKEHTLPAALQSALKGAVEIIGVETGWIWLTEPNHKSVYLAASYNFPPALSEHPERLSGWCYCIKQYLSDDISQPVNISEIRCSRLEDVSTDTKGLKFHATIPISIGTEKVGLMNLLSKASRQLDEEDLAVLNTVSELLSSAIARTRLQQTCHSASPNSGANFRTLFARVFPEMEKVIMQLESDTGNTNALDSLRALQMQFSEMLEEAEEHQQTSKEQEFHYPELPLTKRELEVLTLIKQGLTNARIGEQLYIAERTVKFHVTSILSKLHASTRTEAVDIGLKRGLLKI